MHADVVVSSPMIARESDVSVHPCLCLRERHASENVTYQLLDVPWLSNTGSGRPCVLCELPDTGLEVKGVIRSVDLHVRYVRNMLSRGFLGLTLASCLR